MELPAWQLLVLAAAIGTIWAASLFDWSFVAGRHAFWQFPEGTIPGSQNDMAQTLAGYLYYLQSPWHLPLFYVSALGTGGINVILLGVAPIVALVGKLVHSLTGTTINLYGAYLFLCFAFPGVMMTLVLIATKIRYALATIVGAIFANATPAMLWQWGHIEYQAQFLVIGALALYLSSLKDRVWRGRTAAWILYLSVVYLSNIYIFAMVGTVWLCTVIQRRRNGFVTTREAFGIGVLTVALVTAVIILSGQFEAGNGPPFSTGYGLFSMNLLSPVVPQDSGLFPWVGGVIDPNGYQYEGFNYLGVGLLLASLFVLPAEVGWLRRNLRRHVALAVVCAALTVFAISNRVFAGHWLLFELPLPQYVVWALGTFRASGRFFWLIVYAQVAIVLVLGFRRAQPVMALCLLGAAILQVLDVQPLRAQIIASIASGPGVQELDRGEIAGLIARARHVEVVPSFQCSTGLAQQEKMYRANMDLMFATARMNVPPTPSIRRGTPVSSVLPYWT